MGFCYIINKGNTYRNIAIQDEADVIKTISIIIYVVRFLFLVRCILSNILIYMFSSFLSKILRNSLLHRKIQVFTAPCV